MNILTTSDGLSSNPTAKLSRLANRKAKQFFSK
ncbi:hypothetical protein D047_4714A, partial [Vibrio parahaemolyticus VPTS-2010_2]